MNGTTRYFRPRELAQALELAARHPLRLVAGGYSNKEIADELHISVRTVETHRRAIAKRVGITTRAQTFRFAQDHGLIVV